MFVVVLLFVCLFRLCAKNRKPVEKTLKRVKNDDDGLSQRIHRQVHR